MGHEADHRVREVQRGNCYGTDSKGDPDLTFNKESAATGDAITAAAAAYLDEKTYVKFINAMQAHMSFDPEFPDAASSHLAGLVRDVIAEAEVGSVGELLIEFESGMKLIVPPDEEYEAWGIVGAKGERVTCMPGGEIAAWSGD
ncbi:DUF6188 family protein [Streptomyces sp. E-08]|uniref:DUF6188 family protein n=1 Tax=Streptomyces sp. E-08 TaxID=3404047 RepID=UPI003CF673FF